MNAEFLSTVETIRQFFKITPEQGLTKDTRMLLESMEDVTIPDGQDIVTYGADSSDGMYIILEGTAVVLSGDGAVINMLGVGDFIGELALINDDTRSATVRAKGAVRCANISKALFEELAQRNRHIYGLFMNMLYYKTTRLITEQVRIKTDLEIATRIQTGFLEDDFSLFNTTPYFSVGAKMQPAREVGGDFYDLFWVDETHLCFLIADVSGKGVSAALYTMLAKTHLKNYAALGLPLAEVVSRANDQLCYKNTGNMFVTAFVCVIDTQSGEVTFVNAGHNAPFVLHRDGQFEMHKCRANLVLGCMEGIPYREQTLTLLPGEAIYLYTDGVTEAANPQEELLGNDRCCDALNRHIDLCDRPQEFIDAMYREVEAFAGGAEQSDDITMVLLSRYGHE